MSEIHKGAIDDWYCPECESYVSDRAVTFEENHQLCNTPVVWNYGQPIEHQRKKVNESNQIDKGNPQS